MKHRRLQSSQVEHPPGAPAAPRDASPPPDRNARRDPVDREVAREVAKEGGRVTDREVARRVDVEPEGVRTLVESGTGRRWQVREVDARRVPAAQAERCLIFDAESVVRRLWHYPADWRRMPADELLRLAAR